VCQPRHLLEVGIKGHLVAVARHKRNLQRLARALDRIGELGRKATARRALMCAEVLTHDLLVRERRHRRRRAALREQLQVGGAAQELVHGFWRGALGGSLWRGGGEGPAAPFICSRTAVLFCACLRRPVCASQTGAKKIKKNDLWGSGPAGRRRVAGARDRRLGEPHREPHELRAVTIQHGDYRGLTSALVKLA